MDLLKKAKPSGVCNVCQAPTSRHEALNHRCDAVVNGRRCSGNMKSAVHNLWDECESCQATGKVGTRACTECAGFGWKLYA
jgi:primosomal protein N'